MRMIVPSSLLRLFAAVTVIIAGPHAQANQLPNAAESTVLPSSLLGRIQRDFRPFHVPNQSDRFGDFVAKYVDAGSGKNAPTSTTPQQIVLRTVPRTVQWAPEGGDVPRKYEHKFDAVEKAVYRHRNGIVERNVWLIHWENGGYRVE